MFGSIWLSYSYKLVKMFVCVYVSCVCVTCVVCICLSGYERRWH